MIKTILEELNEGSKKYSVVSGFGENIDMFDTDSPKDAISKWVEWQKVDPMGVYILSADRKDSKEFYNWVYNNLDDFTKIVSKQKTYKTNYLYKEVQAVNLDKINHKDQYLVPFTVG